MRVLVCGGRGFEDWLRLHQTLNELHRKHKFTVLIHGTAKGADTLADQWATGRNLKIERYRPDWKKYGNRAAGPLRNKQMLDEGKPDLVVAFEGGSGTANMMKQARAAGVPVLEIA